MPAPPAPRKVSSRKKLSFRQQQEFEALPHQIEELEGEQRRLTAAVANPDFYREPRERIKETLARLETLQGALAEAYARWDELDSR